MPLNTLYQYKHYFLIKKLTTKDNALIHFHFYFMYLCSFALFAVYLRCFKCLIV